MFSAHRAYDRSISAEAEHENFDEEVVFTGSQQIIDISSSRSAAARSSSKGRLDSDFSANLARLRRHHQLESTR